MKARINGNVAAECNSDGSGQAPGLGSWTAFPEKGDRITSRIWHWLLEVLRIRRRASSLDELAARYGCVPTNEQRMAMELSDPELSDEAFCEKHGITPEKLEDLRNRRVVITVGWIAAMEQVRRAHPGALKRPGPTIKIRGQKHDKGYVDDGVEHCLTQTWRQARWQPGDSIVYKPGELVHRYEGKDYDPDQAEVVKGGWDHDHCEICWWKLDDRDDPVHNTGWTNGEGGWVCDECYERFIRPQLTE